MLNASLAASPVAKSPARRGNRSLSKSAAPIWGPTATNQQIDTIGDVTGVVGAVAGNVIINLNILVNSVGDADAIARKISLILKTTDHE